MKVPMEEGRRRANRFLQSSPQTPQTHREREVPHCVLSGKRHKLSPADSLCPQERISSCGNQYAESCWWDSEVGLCLFELDVGFGMKQARELCCSTNHWTVFCLLILHALSPHPCPLMGLERVSSSFLLSPQFELTHSGQALWACFGDEMASPVSGKLRRVVIFYVLVFSRAHTDTNSHEADPGVISHDLLPQLNSGGRISLGKWCYSWGYFSFFFHSFSFKIRIKCPCHFV